MKQNNQLITGTDWQQIENSLEKNGFALLRQVLVKKECESLRELYNGRQGFRKTVVMEQYRFGLGEYKYFDDPLPELVTQLRENVYPHLTGLANRWMEQVGEKIRFPDTFGEMQDLCRAKNQIRPTPLILKYGEGGHNTLHQDLYGEVFFPLQAVICLSAPGSEFTGGEFILTEQTPRAQSKAIVVYPEQGDMVIFTTSFRPKKGRFGFYRVRIKHGVSEVHTGERFTLGIPFHDAQD